MVEVLGLLFHTVLSTGGAALPSRGSTDIQQHGQIRHHAMNGPRVEIPDHGGAQSTAGTLIGHGGIQVTVRDHHGAAFQGGPDHGFHVGTAGRGKQQGLRARVHRGELWVQHQIPQAFTQIGTPWFTRGQHFQTSLGKAARQAFDLRGLAGPVTTFQRNEQSRARHRGIRLTCGEPERGTGKVGGSHGTTVTAGTDNTGLGSKVVDMAEIDDLHPDTVVVAGGRPAPAHDAPVSPSLVLTSTYRGISDMTDADRGYARMSNPTWDDFEGVLGRLEGSDLPALAVASGLAAVAAVMSLVPAGGRVVMPTHAYQGSQVLVDDAAAAGHLTVTRVDVTDTQATLEAARGADLLWLESPTNPMLEIADLPALLATTRREGILTAVDNTFATPLLQQPLGLGAEIVIHSVTKYLAGHSDVVLGAVVTSNPELRATLQHHRSIHGAVAGPFETWLALRGVRTLALRVERSNQTALELAGRLDRHPAVSRVRYPGLPQDPGHERAAAQMRGGYGAVISMELDTDAAGAQHVVEALGLWTPATSLGGVESLIERRRRHHDEPDSVAESLLRLSVGIENVEDLWADLTQALSTVKLGS